jgi:hypothetical protein
MGAMDVRTDERAAVRVVLRGLPEASTQTRRVEGYTILLLGAPKAESWPGVAVAATDLEGITWTTYRQAEAVQQNLKKNPYVIATSSVKAVADE